MGMKLDRKVQIQRATVDYSGTYPVENWANHGAPQYAARRDLSDSEKFEAGGITSTLQTRFVLRSSAFTRDLTPIDRLTHEGRTFNITGIKELPERRRFLELTCSARLI